MQAHLDVLTKPISPRHGTRGGAPRAMRRFGGTPQIQERCRDQRGFIWLSRSSRTQCRLRSLGRARGFTLTVLAIARPGIGVATFVFDLTAWILVLPSPIRTRAAPPAWFQDKHSPRILISPPSSFRPIRNRPTSFPNTAGDPRTANAVVEGEPVVST